MNKDIQQAQNSQYICYVFVKHDFPQQISL